MQTTNPQTQAQGFFSNVRVYKNETKQSLVHVISESSRIEMPIALYKKILGIHFQEKEVSLGRCHMG